MLLSVFEAVITGGMGSFWGTLGGAIILGITQQIGFWLDPVACYFIFAMMWNLLAGYGGMVSIGQQAYFGLGGYVMLMLGNFLGLNAFIAIALGAVAAGLTAVSVSYVAFRLAGGYFAIGTWVIAEVFRLSSANVLAVGSGSGTSLTALRGGGHCAGLPVSAQQARPRSTGDPRQRSGS